MPDNAKLEFNTEAKGGADQWGFTVRKDHIKCGFACLSIESTQYTTTYTNPITATCNTTSCS